VKSYEEQIRDIAAGGYYKDERTARRFVRVSMSPLWAPRLGLPADTDVSAALRFSDPIVLVIHFFARAVFGHGKKGSRAPRLSRFPVWVEHERVRGVTKAGIAAACGLSLEQVDRALRALRPRSQRGQRIREAGVAYPYALPHGVLLDLLTDPQGHLFCDSGFRNPISMEELGAAHSFGYLRRALLGVQPNEQMEFAGERIGASAAGELGAAMAANDEAPATREVGT
jgi:hypothetical protein